MRGSLFIIVSCSLMLFGCGDKGAKTEEPEQVQYPQVNCIGVLPVSSLGEGQVVPVYLPKDKNSRRGIEVMSEILTEELGSISSIRFVSIDQVGSLDLSGGENSLALARMVGEKIRCDAILETSVKGFVQRVGGRFSITSPAAVAFEMRLFSIDSGAVLWSTKFDEVQKSVMENILEWNKANTRGFTWITAEELMQEGVREKFAASPYFNYEMK